MEGVAAQHGGFFARSPLGFERSNPESKRPVSWVSLPEGEDWLLRPVLRGCCRYESVIDGTLGLADIALLNDALDVQDENERRWQEAQR